MNDDTFWGLIGLLDWSTSRQGEHEQPLVRALSEMDVDQIHEFHALLSEKLYALDTKVHALASIGLGPADDDSDLSGDLFLYARCGVVGQGVEKYALVLAHPAKWPQEASFEELLGVAGTAYEVKTGEEFYCESGPDYETCSNVAGWE